MSAFTYLMLAIVSELIATTSLKLSEGFSKPLPSLLVVVGYGTAFYLMSQALKLAMPIGTAYAIWSGVGTVGIAILGVLFFRETMDFARIVGITLIVAGVLVLNMYSPTAHA
jgi:small multidrug resistance pump